MGNHNSKIDEKGCGRGKGAAARARRRQGGAARRGGARAGRRGGAARGRGGRERGRGMVRAAMDTLSRRGRAARVAVTVIGAALLLAGTFWGRTTTSRSGRSGCTPRRRIRRTPPRRTPGSRASTRPGARCSSPRRTAASAGPRSRASRPAYVADPTRLRQVADAYAERTPRARAQLRRGPDRHPLARHRATADRPAPATDQVVAAVDRP